MMKKLDNPVWHPLSEAHKNFSINYVRGCKTIGGLQVNQIFKQNKIPYLHVAEKNDGAIRLYEALGLKTGRKISFFGTLFVIQAIIKRITTPLQHKFT